MHFGYDDILIDSGAEARAREARLLDRSLALMEAADRPGAPPLARLEAARHCEAVWQRLAEDCASPRNGLDPALRADLVSIGIFVLREMEAIRGGGGNGFGTVREIVGHVRAGLGA